MSSSPSIYKLPGKARSAVVKEDEIGATFIEKLRNLKYTIRPDIRDRATLEANFRQKFEALNRVHLTDGEFSRLLDEIITPDVFTAAKTLRQINENLLGFRSAYLETAQRLKAQQGKDNKDGDGPSPDVEQVDFEFVLFASAVIDYDYIMGLIAKFSEQGPGKQKMSREQEV